MVCQMPTHAPGDLLVAFVNKDTASAFTTPSGWTAQQTQTSIGAAGGVYTKRAASSAETVTFTLSLETCCAVVLAVQNVNGTTDADAVSGSAKSGADDFTLPLTGVGITPGHNNCLILHGLSTDVGLGANALPPWVNLFAGDTGQNSLCVSYTQQKTAATITAPDHWAGAADDSRGFILAIRDDGAAAVFDAYLPLGAGAPATQITPLNGSSGVVDKGSYRSIAVITSVAGKTVTSQSFAVTADSGINPFRGSLRNTGVSSTTNLHHVELPLTSAVDLTAQQGLVFGTFLHLAPRDYVDSGSAEQGGKYLLIGSSTADWRVWVVGGQFSKTDRPDARNNYLIEVATTDTVYGSAGAANMAAAIELAFGASGYYGLPAILWNELYLLGVVTLAGGGSTPFGFDEFVFALNNGCGLLPLAQQSGSSAILWAPIRFGGTDPIHIDCDLNGFQFPRKADEIDYVDFHVSNNKIGVEFYGLAGDTLSFTNCIFTSPSSYYWRFHASHSGSAALDFAGTSVINAVVTLRATSDLTTVNFIACSGFAQNGAALTDCSFQNTTVVASTPADAALITANRFVSFGTGHGLEIGGTAANVTLSNLDFINFAGTDGSTGNEAIYINIASGSMSITISGGTTPSIRTAGCTVTVIAGAVTVAVNVKNTAGSNIQNARVLLKAATGGPFPFDATVTIVNSGTTATVTHTAHGMATTDKILIKGASHLANNGTFTITKIDANSYSYTMGSAPGSNPTGTIKATFVCLEGLTDSSGNVNPSASRVYPSAQPVSGWARKGSAAPFYKEALLGGSVSNTTGYSASLQLVADE
jgi:hypothetical protein